MPAVRLVGRPASPGLARGPVVRLAAVGSAPRVAGDSAGEDAALRAAIRTAVDSLKRLALQAGSTGAEILEFQIAMLEDETLAAGAFAEIADGVPAHRAWRGALDREIAGYAAGDDDYFRARATDLEDIRDRVLDALTGASSDGIPPGSVVFADDLTPSRFLATDWTGGAIVLSKGSPAGHVAVLARGRGVPMVVGVRTMADALGSHPAEAVVDGARGLILIGPDAADLDEIRTLGRAAAETALRHATYLSLAGGHRGRHAGRRSRQHRGSGRARRPRPGVLRRHRPCADGAPVRDGRAAGRGPPGRGLSADRRMGIGQARHHPHARCGRRQADPGPHRGGRDEPVPRPARVEADARTSGPLPHAAPRARPRGRPWPRRDHGADGDGPGGAPGRPCASRRGDRRPSPPKASPTGGRLSA